MKDTLFLIDTWNNKKVVGEFNSQDEVNEYLNNKEFTENWENTVESFEDFKDGFYTVSGASMRTAVRLFGKRRLQHWS